MKLETIFSQLMKSYTMHIFFKERYREFHLIASYEGCDKEFEEFRTFEKSLYHWKVEMKKLLH